jgi:hypothetical protein
VEILAFVKKAAKGVNLVDLVSFISKKARQIGGLMSAGELRQFNY